MKTGTSLMLGAAMLAITAASVQATGFANYFAVVSPTGGVTQGVGIVSATRKTVGRYEIKFARPLVFCAYFATIRGVQPGMITAAKKNGVTDIAIVRTFSKTGVSADMPFNLLVQCNS